MHKRWRHHRDILGGRGVQSALSRIRGLGEPNITMRLQTPGGRVLLSVVRSPPCFQLIVSCFPLAPP